MDIKTALGKLVGRRVRVEQSSMTPPVVIGILINDDGLYGVRNETGTGVAFFSESEVFSIQGSTIDLDNPTRNEQSIDEADVLAYISYDDDEG